MKSEGQNTDRSSRRDGHEKEFDPCRRDLACDRLVCARRWRRSLDPLYLSAASAKHMELDAMTHSWRVTDPVALRPTWKGNLLMLVVALVVLLAVAS